VETAEVNPLEDDDAALERVRGICLTFDGVSALVDRCTSWRTHSNTAPYFKTAASFRRLTSRLGSFRGGAPQTGSSLTGIDDGEG
jgi:hypothetical protein